MFYAWLDGFGVSQGFSVVPELAFAISSRTKRFHQQSILKLAVLVRDLVLVERIHFHLLLARHVVVCREDGARLAHVVPQPVADDGFARDPRREVKAVAVAERSERVVEALREVVG